MYDFFIKHQITHRDLLAFAAVLAVTIGLVISRSMFSFGLLFMGLYWVSSKDRFSILWGHPFYVLSMVVSFLPLISDIIHGQFITPMSFTKLTFPLFIQFFYVWRPLGKSLSLLNRIILLIFFITSLTTIILFYKNYDDNVSLYEYAKVMHIGVYSDHIRLSVAIALSTIVAWYQHSHSESVFEKRLLVFYILFQFIFLHLLAARTGLVVLYFCNMIYLISMLFKKTNKYAFLFLIALIILPMISFKIFPSFYNRIGYTLYDFAHYKNMQYREGSSDGFRFFSMICGFDIGKENLTSGVGHSQMKNECNKWFMEKFPAILEDEIIFPSNEFLFHFMMIGLPGLIIFILFSLSPFLFKTLRANPFFISIYASLFVTYFFEILLENQFGLGVTGLFTAWAWHVCITNQKKEAFF